MVGYALIFQNGKGFENFSFYMENWDFFLGILRWFPSNLGSQHLIKEP